MPVVRCKNYHSPRSRRNQGVASRFGKSQCPAWAAAPNLQQRLIDEALEEPDGPSDCFGRPQRMWNVIAGWCFIVVSTNEQAAACNCYPNEPSTALHEELARRSQRSIGDFMAPERGNE